jgi:hypothetical protein
MDEDRKKVRAEAQAWLFAALLVGALALYGVWIRARQDERLAREMHSTEQVAPTSTRARRTP